MVIYKNLETNEKFTATGNNLPIQCDCILTGKMVQNKKYGEQLNVTVAEEILPTMPDKMVDYLVFSKIKHVGRVIAKRIVDKFGDLTYEAMESPILLATVKGISAAKAESIAEEYAEKKELKKYFEILAELGVPSSKVQTVYKTFSKMDNGLEMIEKHPYMLCICEGISFSKIDGIMKKRPEYSPYYIDRVRYGVMEAFYQNEKKGHVFATCNDIIMSAQKILTDNWIDFGYLISCIKWIVNQLVREQKVVFEYGMLYRKKLHEAECYVTEKLMELFLANFKNPKTITEVQDAVKKAQEDTGFKLSAMQEKGVQAALMNNICIITGGPGRGKTTLLKVLLASEKILRPDCDISLCAPTGRASRKMTENTGEYASTIHHLIGIRQEDDSGYELNDVEADVLVIDEMSMTSMELMWKMLTCISPGTRIIFVGDKDQLPSVAAGNVFADMILSGVFPTVMLDTNFRQSAGSSIIDNADKINENRMPLAWDNSSMIVNTYKEKDTLDSLMYIVKDMIEKSVFEADDIQILTPFRKSTEIGSVKLNTHLQTIFNPAKPDKKEIKTGERVFRIGDRVMHLENEEEVSNGDVGYVTDIDYIEKEIIVKFETGVTKTYKNAEFVKIEHAFALTIHKSQGSEYPCVLMPFVDIFGTMRQRQLLYTAATRAKKFWGVIGNEESIKYASGNVGERRKSYLAYRLVCEKEKKEVKKAG